MNKFSIVIPIFNELKNIQSLIDEINISLKSKYIYEIIFIDDCSTDGSSELLKKLYENKKIVLKNHNINLGQSSCIKSGIEISNFDTIITIDGDGQNDPRDIHKLVELFFNSKLIKLVGGIRKKRKDNFYKIISSKIANHVRSFVLKDDCLDTGCSLKVFDKRIFLLFPFFEGIHRFLPALFKGFGYEITFIDVTHRPRINGVSKYGTLDRLFKGIIDIIRVKKIIKKYKENI